MDTQIDGQTGGHTDTQTDAQTDTQTDIIKVFRAFLPSKIKTKLRILRYINKVQQLP